MSEFLLRGYNVAMPEVDLGDDILVIEDRTGRYWRVQVKTAIGKRRRKDVLAKVAVSEAQLSAGRDPNFYFVFAIRHEARWEFLLVHRARLSEEYRTYKVASESGGKILFTLRLTEAAVICGGRDWQAWRGNWAEWPVND